MKTPERIHFHKSFNFDQLPSGSSDINIHKDDIEYIRKDKVIEFMMKAWSKGVDDQASLDYGFAENEKFKDWIEREKPFDK